MTNLLDERERAAENLYAHNEELAFLAHRTGVSGLATWAALGIGLSPGEAQAYERMLVDAFIGGLRDDEIIALVRGDLERAGQVALAASASTVLAQSIASAGEELSGRAPSRPLGRPVALRHASHPIDATLSWFN